MSFKEYFIRFITEGHQDSIVIHGEYWFDERGNAQYADGDVGDMNHENYVILRCGNEVLDYFDLSFDGRFEGDISGMEDEILNVIRQEVGDSWGDIENDPADTIIKYLVTFYKIPEEKASDLVLTAYGSTKDAREYAIKNWNWIRVHGPNIEVNKLNANTLKKVAEGIRDALDQEGEMYEDDSYEKADRGLYRISTYSGRLYTITLDDMERGNISGLETDIPQKTAATQQLRQQDIKSMSSYYQNKGVIGDSFNWKTA